MSQRVFARVLRDCVFFFVSESQRAVSEVEKTKPEITLTGIQEAGRSAAYQMNEFARRRDERFYALIDSANNRELSRQLELDTRTDQLRRSSGHLTLVPLFPIGIQVAVK